MTFQLSREQELLVKLTKEFAENEIAPLAEEIDRTGEFPSDIV